MKKSSFAAMLGLMACLLAWTPKAQAQSTNDEFTKAVLQYVELTGAFATVNQMVPTLIDAAVMQGVSLSAQDRQEIIDKLDKLFRQRAIDIYVPVYKKHFTLAEMKQIIAFYQTPVGRKLGSKTPQMMQESMNQMASLGMELAQELQKELEKRGIQ